MPKEITHVQVHESKLHLTVKWITVIGILIIALLAWNALTNPTPPPATPAETQSTVQ